MLLLQQALHLRLDNLDALLGQEGGLLCFNDAGAMFGGDERRRAGASGFERKLRHSRGGALFVAGLSQQGVDALQLEFPAFRQRGEVLPELSLIVIKLTLSSLAVNLAFLHPH